MIYSAPACGGVLHRGQPSALFHDWLLCMALQCATTLLPCVFESQASTTFSPAAPSSATASRPPASDSCGLDAERRLSEAGAPETSAQTPRLRGTFASSVCSNNAHTYHHRISTVKLIPSGPPARLALSGLGAGRRGTSTCATRLAGGRPLCTSTSVAAEPGSRPSPDRWTRTVSTSLAPARTRRRHRG
jgi:hypothetical protein